MATKKPQRPRIPEGAIINVITKNRQNPKLEGSAAHKRFDLYEDGMTVGEAKAAGVTSTDVTYDFDHKFISLTAPATLLVPPKMPRKKKRKPGVAPAPVVEPVAEAPKKKKRRKRV